MLRGYRRRLSLNFARCPLQPAKYDDILFRMSLRIIPYAVLLHFAFGLWFFGAWKTLKTQTMNSVCCKRIGA